MKLFYLLFACLPLQAFSQNVVFWTEDFGSGCNSGQMADEFNSFNGTWVITSTGINATGANTWFVSAEENGNEAGECGSGCGDDQSLHLGAFESFLGTDIGAAYYEGLDGLCDILDCGATDKRVESPVINCLGLANMAVEFVYLEGGNAIDNATLWYFDGSTWSELSDLPKTALSCSPQGLWTTYSIPLPLSANNNAFVQIGFRWINNDDGDATDPSVAIDDIAVSGDFGVDGTPPVLTCPADHIVTTNEDCVFLADYISQTIVEDDFDPFPVMTQTPDANTPIVGEMVVTIGATDASGNSSSCSFTVTAVDDDPPVIICMNTTVSIAEGETEGNVPVPGPGVTENCGDYTTTNSFNGTANASGIYPAGVTDVTWTATDTAGNPASCISTITVNVETNDCCTGDFNCDGFISVTDMLILISQYGCTGCQADLDENGVVGVGDMQIFIGLYGTICP